MRSILTLALVLTGCGSMVRSERAPLAADTRPLPDRDHDGVAADRCADASEDRDGFRDNDGCPDLDDDEDTIPDAADLCRCVAEDRDGFDDDDGCPDPDDDGDQLVDACDACPRDPETHDGCGDDDGCPDHARVAVDETRLAIVPPVRFAEGSSGLSAEAVPLLHVLAATLSANGEITRVRVVGHSDFGERHPDELSERRARAVHDALVARGIDAALLTVWGVADAQPLRARTLPAGARQENRRVELEIVEIAGEPADTRRPPTLHAPSRAACEHEWRSPCADRPPPSPRDVCAPP